ncbi:MAG: transporter [Planctomycetia bacterium]
MKGREGSAPPAAQCFTIAMRCFHPRPLLAAVLIVLASAVCEAAPSETWPELNTDRDAFTPSTFTVDPGRLLTEFSYVYIDNRDARPTNSFPELLCRYAANEWLEWRGGINYAVGSQGNVVTSVEAGEVNEPGVTSYETSVLYGLKASLRDQRGLLPQACFIMEGDTPIRSERLGTVPIATLVAGWELPVVFPMRDARPWRLDGALRYSYLEGNAGWFSRWGPSTVLRMPVTDRFELHAEWFGTFSDGLPKETSRPFFSPGGHIVLTKRFEIGLRVGWGLTPDAAPFFSDAGCAWRY